MFVANKQSLTDYTTSNKQTVCPSLFQSICSSINQYTRQQISKSTTHTGLPRQIHLLANHLAANRSNLLHPSVKYLSISVYYSVFTNEFECEWTGEMNGACGNSTRERITGESTRCAPLSLVSIPCLPSLAFSLFRDIELFIT